MPFLGIYPKEIKPLMSKNICIPVFIDFLHVVDKIWNQSKCTQMDEYIETIWNIYIIIYNN